MSLQAWRCHSKLGMMPRVHDLPSLCKGVKITARITCKISLRTYERIQLPFGLYFSRENQFRSELSQTCLVGLRSLFPSSACTGAIGVVKQFDILLFIDKISSKSYNFLNAADFSRSICCSFYLILAKRLSTQESCPNGAA